MHPLLARTKARVRDAAKPLGAAAVGALTVGLLRATRYFDPAKTADLFGRLSRLDRLEASRGQDRSRGAALVIA
jgi:Kdo2-lipid IVA lauroyltransferase/acyltransferase